jgi:hypothetical protein
LRRGHANLLCIVPILNDVPKYIIHKYFININTDFIYIDY